MVKKRQQSFSEKMTTRIKQKKRFIELLEADGASFELTLFQNDYIFPDL